MQRAVMGSADSAVKDSGMRCRVLALASVHQTGPCYYSMLLCRKDCEVCTTIVNSMPFVLVYVLGHSSQKPAVGSPT